MDTLLRPLTPGAVVMVSGISQYQEAARSTFIGDDVLLTHEVSNAYDKFAVRIDDSQGNTLGYVPRAGQLNERLLVNNAGAVFKGVIVEKFDTETCGLRVRITERLGRRDAQFGSDMPGVRDLEGRPDKPEPAPESAQEVFSRTGRRLGTLVEATGDKVRAKNAAGTIVSYPASVVDVRDPAPAMVEA